MSIKFEGGAHVRCDGCKMSFIKGRLMSLDELVLAAINVGKFTIDDNNPNKHYCPKCQKDRKAKGGKKK